MSTRLSNIESSASPQQVEEWGSGWAPKPSVSLTPPGDSDLSPNSEVTHYLNPEARLKLRMYLGSASRFDEVIEFGFPSLKEDKDQSSGCRPQTLNTESQREFAKYFGTTTTCSGITPTVHEPASSPESIRTSSDFFSIPYQSLSETKSTTPQDRKSEYQAQLRNFDRDTLGLINRREMTIRMTLTRPDLRANESLLYPHQQQERPRTSHDGYNKDPLQLEPLSLNEVMPPITPSNQRSFALKRLWNRKA